MREAKVLGRRHRHTSTEEAENAKEAKSRAATKVHRPRQLTLLEHVRSGTPETNRSLMEIDYQGKQ